VLRLVVWETILKIGVEIALKQRWEVVSDSHVVWSTQGVVSECLQIAFFFLISTLFSSEFLFNQRGEEVPPQKEKPLLLYPVKCAKEWSKKEKIELVISFEALHNGLSHL
jgi:hypothetical protein